MFLERSLQMQMYDRGLTARSSMTRTWDDTE
jgi:hypothetical protein